VTPCSLVDGYECLGRTYCTHLLDRGPKNEGSRFLRNVYNRISKYTSSYPRKQNLLVYESTAQKTAMEEGLCNMLQTGHNNTERQSLFYRMSEKSSLILSIYLSIYLSICLSVCLSVCRSVYGPTVLLLELLLLFQFLNPIHQCFSTAGPRPGTGPWHQLVVYRALV
jgi:hypothetical protein